MKLLSVVFLVGLALASAIPVPSHDLSLDDADDLDLLIEYTLQAEGGDDITTELGKKLQDQLDQILEKIKDAIDKGKALKDDYLQKVKEIRNQMKDFGIDMGNKGRELIKNIKDKAKDYWRKIFDKLNPDSEKRSLMAEEGEDDDIKTELGKKLREQLDALLEKIVERINNGKVIKEDIINEIKELREKMKNMRVELGKRAKALLEKIKDRARDFWKRIFDKMNPDTEKRSLIYKRSIREEITRVLKEAYDKALENIQKLFERGQDIPERLTNKFKDLRGKLKDYTADLDQKARDMAEKLTGKAREAYEKFLEMIGIKEPSIEFAEEGDEIKTELGKKVKAHLDEILEKIREAIERGKGIKEETWIKLKELKELMKEKGIEIGEKAENLLLKIKKIGKEYLKKILDRLGLRDVEKRSTDDEPQTELGKRLRKEFDAVLEKLKDAVDKGKLLKEEYIVKLKELREQMRDLKVDIGNRAKELLEKIKNKAHDYWQKILDKFRPEETSMYFAEGDDDGPKTELGKKLRKHLDEILEQIRDAIDNGRVVKDETLKKVKDIHGKLVEIKEHIGVKAKALFDKIRKEGKDYLNKILEKLGLSKRAIEMHTEAILMEAEEESDLANKLKEKFNEFAKKIKDILNNGGNLKDAVEKLKEIRQKLKDLRVKVGEKGDKMIGNLRQKIRDYFNRLLERLGKEKRAFDWREKLREIRDKILDRFDPEDLKDRVEKIFGKGNEWSEKIIKALKEKGELAKQKLLELIDKYLEDQEAKRSIKEVYEKIKDYFRNLRIELKEKFMKFGEWAKDKYEKGLERGRDKSESLRNLAKEFISDAKNLSRDVLDQAKDFFREYKEDLGTVYDDVREKIREILKGKE